MRRALFFAYYFPPIPGIGSTRTLKFITFLRDSGWEVDVVTPWTKGWQRTDPGLLDAIPEWCTVYRTRSVDHPFWNGIHDRLGVNRHWTQIPDDKWGWVPFAIREGRRRLSTGDYSLIYTSGGPHSSHFIGSSLNKETGIPWVADLRDPWTFAAVNRHPTRIHRALDTALERRVLSRAARIVTTSPGTLRRYTEILPHLEERFTIITNGFDESDLQGRRPRQRTDDAFQLLFFGTIYEPMNCDTFIRSLELVRTRHPDSRIVCMFLGNVDPSYMDLARELGVEIQRHPPVPHGEALEWAMAADAFLLFMFHGSEGEYIIHGKLGELLRIGKPILSFSTETCDLAGYMERSGIGTTVSPTDPEEGYRAIMDLYRTWEDGKPAEGPPGEMVEAFERRSLTRQLASLFDEVMDERTSAGE